MIEHEEGGPVRVAQPPGPLETRVALGAAVRGMARAAADGEGLIPYEKADRIPAALQHLEALTADFIGLNADWFVSLLGAVVDKGSVALFAEVREVGQLDFRLYRIVSYDSGTGKFTHTSRIERADAERLYYQRVEELS